MAANKELELMERIVTLEVESREREKKLTSLVERFEDAMDNFALVVVRMNAVPDAVHSQHHAMFEQELAARKARRAFWEGVAKHVVSVNFVSVIGLIGLVLWYGVKQLLNLKGGG